MGLISLVEYAERHGKSRTTVQQKAKRGGFKTAQKIGRNWVIDENEPYEDHRVKTGNFKNWRNKAGESRE